MKIRVKCTHSCTKNTGATETYQPLGKPDDFCNKKTIVSLQWRVAIPAAQIFLSGAHAHVLDLKWKTYERMKEIYK